MKKTEGRKRPLPVLAEEQAVLDLLRTTEFLSRPFDQLMKAEDLSATQYNVLRILRGASEGLACGEIGNRMITHDSDITRLLDRMEKRGLISRSRDAQDRRMVLTRITPGGLDLLERTDEPVREIHRRQLGHMGRERLEMLRNLLRVCRGEAD